MGTQWKKTKLFENNFFYLTRGATFSLSNNDRKAGWPSWCAYPPSYFFLTTQLSTLSEADAAFYKQYGRLPKPKPLIKQHKVRTQNSISTRLTFFQTQFDSADWAQKKQTGEVGAAGGPRVVALGGGPAGVAAGKKTFVTNK